MNISSVAGRVAGKNRGVYNMTKFGLGAFSESLRQEVTKRQRPRLAGRAGLGRDRSWPVTTAKRCLRPCAPSSPTSSRCRPRTLLDAITYIVTRPWHIAVNEMLIRPTEQE